MDIGDSIMGENNIDNINWVKEKFDKFLRDNGKNPETMKHEEKSSMFTVFAFLGYEVVDDIDEIWSSDITDGPDDKNVDFCRIDENTGKVFVAQGYLSKDEWGSKNAPTNKAKGLNTAMSWLMVPANINNMKSVLKQKAVEVRKAIKDDKISEIHVLYVHNLCKSKSCSTELEQVTASVASHVRTITKKLSNSQTITVVSKELGVREIYDLYKSKEKTILIDDVIPLPPNTNCLREYGNAWQSAVISVPCKWIFDLHQKYEDILFSDNFRGYMGNTPRRKSINKSIQETASNNPDNFWVFNNGITALVTDMNFSKKNMLDSIRGISIINGAQTTGSLKAAYLAEDIKEDPKVLLRIIKCDNNDELVDNIIRYNNTQNEIRPEDKRSKDKLQIRLGKEFGDKYKIFYEYRRSVTDGKNPLKIFLLGKILCAFHINFQWAFRSARNIFDEDSTYQKTFPDDISADHCVVIYALSKAIDATKSSLKKQTFSEKATPNQQEQYKIMQYSVAKYFLLCVIEKVIVDILDRNIPNKFLIVPKKKGESLKALTIAWEALIKGIMPLIVSEIEQCGKKHKIDNPSYEIPRDKDYTDEIAKEVVVKFQMVFNNVTFHHEIAKLLKVKSA